MESQELRIFQCVAEELSFSKAAERLGYVQSNITLRIQKLEQELGVPLFERTNKGVTLLPAGEKLLHYSKQVIHLLEEGKKEVAATPTQAVLRIGATQTLAAQRLPVLLSRYYREFPQAQLSIKTSDQKSLLRNVAHNELDGAFISDQFQDEQVEAVMHWDEELVLISQCGVPPRNLPMIVNAFPDCPYRRLLFEWFERHQQQPSSVIEFDTLNAILTGVREGIGISLLPKSVVPPDMNCMPLPDGLRHVGIQFIVKKTTTRTHALTSFIQMMEKDR
ncbi:LysR family transcriptional regulator [Paenibacillus guangzhouensis]|uniref:LysR family transcriptional regulator n=1 Tax=Paenibacillus guangzhouensis TaxID=1473112 RepID=UPI00126728C9|nr:LysR family transcriptional regulator [Paenibacillus guangzhouensis]